MIQRVFFNNNPLEDSIKKATGKKWSQLARMKFITRESILLYVARFNG